MACVVVADNADAGDTECNLATEMKRAKRVLDGLFGRSLFRTRSQFKGKQRKIDGSAITPGAKSNIWPETTFESQSWPELKVGPIFPNALSDAMFQVLHIHIFPGISAARAAGPNGSGVAGVGSTTARAVAPTVETRLSTTGKTKEEIATLLKQHPQQQEMPINCSSIDYITDDIPEYVLQSRSDCAVAYCLCFQLVVCMTRETISTECHASAELDHKVGVSSMDLSVPEEQRAYFNRIKEYQYPLIVTALARLSVLVLGLVVVARLLSDVTYRNSPVYFTFWQLWIAIFSNISIFSKDVL